MIITAAVYGERFESIILTLRKLLNTPSIKSGTIEDKFTADLADFRKRGFLSIAFVGEYSAGKSSLISALTGRRDLNISADIATDHATEYEWNGVHLIDTPGIGTEHQDHDARTYESIARADLLIYCLTCNLFDTTTLNNFKSLAFDSNYQSKMFLLINKMSAETGNVEQRIKNYTTSLKASIYPHTLDLFPIAFCDARDQLDGEDEGDSELKDLSRFNILTELLNNFIDAKGATARLDTPIRIVLAYLDDIVERCGRDEGRDDQQDLVIKKMTGIVKRHRRSMQIKFDQVIDDLARAVNDQGSALANDVGVKPIEQSDLDRTQTNIEQLCLKSSDELQTELKVASETLKEELAKEFESPLMQDFISNADLRMKAQNPELTEFGSALQKNLGVLSRIADIAGKGVSLSLKGVGATSSEAGKKLVTATQVSKSALTQGIKSVGKFVGFKFKPWQAASWSKNIANSMPYIGIILSVGSLFADITSEVEAVRNDAKLRKAKRDLLNGFQNVAESVSTEFRKVAQEAMRELYGEVESFLAEMKENHEHELGASNDTIRQVALLRKECEQLLQQI